MSQTSERARSSAPPPPDVDADTIIHSRRAFCLALKAARERRGLSIAAIAATTKVCPSHFEALERGDVRHWPQGLYRRTFFRGYVELIGLPIAETTDEFVRLFPAADSGPRPAAKRQPAEETLPLLLDESWHGTKTPIGVRLAAAALDAAAVLLFPVALAWLIGASRAPVIAIVAVSYYTIATAWLGESPAAWLLRQRSRLARIWRRRVDAAPAPKIIAEPRGAFRVGEENEWTTDARRVRPRYMPPRMRVRFKWS